MLHHIIKQTFYKSAKQKVYKMKKSLILQLFPKTSGAALFVSNEWVSEILNVFPMVFYGEQYNISCNVYVLVLMEWCACSLPLKRQTKLVLSEIPERNGERRAWTSLLGRTDFCYIFVVAQSGFKGLIKSLWDLVVCQFSCTTMRAKVQVIGAKLSVRDYVEQTKGTKYDKIQMTQHLFEIRRRKMCYDLLADCLLLLPKLKWQHDKQTARARLQ